MSAGSAPNLWDEFAAVAARRGEAPALVAPRRDGGEAVSYAALERRARALAESLTAAGIGRGAVLLAYIGDRPELLTVLLACSRVRATLAVLEPRSTAHELASVLERVDSDHPVVTVAELADAVPAACRSRIVLDGEAVDTSALAPAPPASPELRDAALVQFTSGSTGRPKGIVIGHAALVHRPRNFVRTTALGPDDRTLCTLPLSHSHGTDCLALPSLLSGGRLILQSPTAAAPNTVFRLIEEHRVSLFSSVPGFYDVAAKLIPGGRHDLASWRLALCGSAPLAPGTSREFRRRFGVTILQGYGLAEVGGICLNLAAAERENYGSIGRPIHGVACRIADDGELAVRSPALCSGYLGEPEAWSRVFVGGELFSGDLVEQDADGYLTLVGRKSSFVSVGGQKVYPAEIEQELMELEFVREAAVTGAADPLAGQCVVAHVALLEPAAPDEERRLEARMRAALAERLSDFKRPRRYVFHADLPKSPLGKILRERLHGEHGGEHA